jgi:hypothetical protein
MSPTGIVRDEGMMTFIKAASTDRGESGNASPLGNSSCLLFSKRSKKQN